MGLRILLVTYPTKNNRAEYFFPKDHDLAPRIQAGRDMCHVLMINEVTRGSWPPRPESYRFAEFVRLGQYAQALQFWGQHVNDTGIESEWVDVPYQSVSQPLHQFVEEWLKNNPPKPQELEP